MADPRVRNCLTSDQALADFANIIIELKSNLSVPRSPVITFGGSYAGMLAARFRMIYPNITNGSLASSAPVLMSSNVPANHQYCYIVSQDFKSESEECYDYISRSWGVIDKVASQPGGLETLARAFSTCSPLPSADNLKTYLASIYDYVAQYNGRFGRISKICDVVIAQAVKNNLLKGIGDAILSLNPNTKCNNFTETVAKPFTTFDPSSEKAYDWQVCNELVPYQYCSDNTMFERSSFNLSTFSESCFRAYGSYPHPIWSSTAYHGRDLKTATNIVFSNGLIDPYSGASILEDLSDSVVSITTKEGSHCLDLTAAQKDDPKWLKDQRDSELKLIAKWLNVTLSSDKQLVVWAMWSRFLVVLVILQFITCVVLLKDGPNAN